MQLECYNCKLCKYYAFWGKLKAWGGLGTRLGKGMYNLYIDNGAWV